MGRKKVIAFFLIICCLMFTACDDFLLRKSPYSAKDMETYLEEEYGTDLIILSRKEIYDCYFGTVQEVEYEVGYADGREDTFRVTDMHDGGMAGWNVHID